MIVSLEQVMKAAIEPALALLPHALDSVPARLLLVAIALQESGLAARYQRLAGGGARCGAGLLAVRARDGQDARRDQWRDAASGVR